MDVFWTFLAVAFVAGTVWLMAKPKPGGKPKPAPKPELGGGTR